jgi:phosphatidate cytidylyltransferase
MKRVLTAVVLIPLVLLALFRAPVWLLALAVSAIVLLALREYLNLATSAGLSPFRRLTYVMSLLPFALLWIRGWPSEHAKVEFSLLFSLNALLVLMAAAVVFGVPLVFRKDLRMGLASVGASILGVIYVGISLSLLVCLRADQRVLSVFVLFSVWAGDIAAYYVGRSIGRHKLAPVVSPNKSWEGAIASVIASVAVALLIFHCQARIEGLFAGAISGSQRLLAVPHLSFATGSGYVWFDVKTTTLHAIMLGILTNVAAQLGDLFESALKRGANVKDSGALLPGHGGVLDRIDALLFAIPVVWYYAQLTGFLQPKTF